MGGRPTFVGFIALAIAILGVGTFAAPRSATAEIRVPLPGSEKKFVKRKRFRRPSRPSRNPDRVFAGVSAAAISPEVADNSEAAVVVGTSSSASVVLALRAPRAKRNEVKPATTASLPGPDAADPEDEVASNDSLEDETAKDRQDEDRASVENDPAETAEAPSETDEAQAGSPPDANSDSIAVALTDAEERAGEVSEVSGSEGQKEETADTEVANASRKEEDADEDTASVEADPSDARNDPSPETEAAETKTVEAETDETETPASRTDEARVEEPAKTAELEPTGEAVELQETDAPEPQQSVSSEDAEVIVQITDKPADKPDVAVPDAARAADGTSVVLEVSPPPDSLIKAAESTEDGAEAATPAADAKSEEKVAALTPPNAPADTPPEMTDVPPVASASEETPSTLSADEQSEATETGEDADPAAVEIGAPGDGEQDTTETAEESNQDVVIAISEPPPPPAHPVIATVRDKLEETGNFKDVASSDLAALRTFYGEREEPPLWITEAGFSQKAKTIMTTIEEADDWGLDASSFDLPGADAIPASEEAQADAEIALSAAILSYARDAQIGRLTPSRVSKLFDQHPKLRDPKTVLTETGASETPDRFLVSLHPQQTQFKRLQQALVRARDSARITGRDPERDRNVQLIVMNMERWRWLPRQLGNYYVWNNVPEFQVRVLKGGQTIYQEKTIVGQLKYATPFFSAPMRDIVFNPNWTVPPTIVREDIAPKLQGASGGGIFGQSKKNILRRYGLAVSYKGEPIDADTVDWNNVNVHKYTFTQDAGPANVLGQFKFNFPNKHAIYMHDTVQRELFSVRTRTLSHGCIRVHQPDRLAALLLGEDKGWSLNQVRSLATRNDSKVISFNKRVPVHLTYFTATVDENGTVRDFTDIYGIDNRMAPKLFTNPEYFPMPAVSTVAETSPGTRPTQPRRRSRANNGLDGFLTGLFGN